MLYYGIKLINMMIIIMITMMMMIMMIIIIIIIINNNNNNSKKKHCPSKRLLPHSTLGPYEWANILTF